MDFGIFTTVLSLAVAASLAFVLWRDRVRRGDDDTTPSFDIQVYRDQLSEIDRDLERGVIAPDNAERARAEVSRRILAADAQAGQAQRSAAAGQLVTWGIAALVVIGVTGGSWALYGYLGAPGYGDLALKDRIAIAETLRETRPGQAEAEENAPAAPPTAELSSDYLALVQQLRDTVAERPDDIQGQQLLARHEAATGDIRAAYSAQSRVLELKGGAAQADDFTRYADMLILAAGGYVSPEAESALAAALDRDSSNGIARYYWGLMLAQTGRPDQAFNVWNRLLAEGPQDAPWIAPIRGQIEQMARLAGVQFTLPPVSGLRGPTAEDVEAAGDMDAEDRMAMIRGMVDQLSDRLADEGGTPDEWARLITALGVLGETDTARDIYAEARETFAGNATAMELIEAAAGRAGVAE